MTSALRKRILLVDDDPVGAELTLAALAVIDPGVGVDVVGDGEEALDYIFRRGAYSSREAQMPGSILLDLNMPKVDGHEVLRQIRSDPGVSGMKIVVLTSSDHQRDRRLSEQFGTDEYVVKPASIANLIGELRRCAPLLFPPGDRA